MPITLPFELTQVSQTEFGEIAFSVMEHVFAIHNEFGRFIHEKLVKRELALRVDDLELEVPITVSHLNFSKVYYLDALLKRRALFEFKCVDGFHSRHRAQLLNYLVLTGLNHGKLINTRTEQVEHEFVNCGRRYFEMREPEYVFADWSDTITDAARFAELLRGLVADWGTGLELKLYQDALAFFFQGLTDVPILGSSIELGMQPMHLVSPAVAFKLTAFKSPSNGFAVHAQRLLRHTHLQSIFWVNMTAETIEFVTIQR